MVKPLTPVLSQDKLMELARTVDAVVGADRMHLSIVVSPGGRVQLTGNVPRDLVNSLLAFTLESGDDATDFMKFGRTDA